MQCLQTAAAKLNLMSIPKCAACLYRKQHSQPVLGKITSVIKDKSSNHSADQLRSGQQVHLGHFNCLTCGKLFPGFVTKDPKLWWLIPYVKSYCGGCLFVDFTTNYLHIEIQSFLSTAETI